MHGLILTAAPVGGGMGAVFGDLPSALVPLAGRPLLLSILQEMSAAGIREITVAVGHQSARVRALCERFRAQGLSLRFVEVDPQASAGAALQQALTHFHPGTVVLVHLGDTLVPGLSGVLATLPPRGHAVMVAADAPDGGRWCCVRPDSGGYVARFVERADSAAGLPVAVGVYRIGGVPESWPELPARPEISDVLQACAPARGWRMATVPHWHDVGHLDRYQVARKRVLESRAFNTLQFDDFLGTVTKRSRHWAKLQAEVRWALALPPSLQALAPRVLEFVPDGADTHVTMEYYGYPSAAELWLYSSLGAPLLEGMVRRLGGVLDRLAAQPRVVEAADCDRLYRVKTEQRVAEAVQGSPVLARLFDADTLEIDGVVQAGWRRLWARTLPLLPALHDPRHAALVHGDFCLSNLLFDIGGGIVRLIDARGDWAEADGTAGDAKYDVAKLRHSLAGDYDFIVGDLFDLQCDGLRTLRLRTASEPRHHAVAAAFDAWIAQRYDLRQIQLIQALLFISMLPMHADRPRRQLAMFATGLRGLARAVSALEVPLLAAPGAAMWSDMLAEDLPAVLAA
jgi:dTDP-glucose pyrophosphorylase